MTALLRSFTLAIALLAVPLAMGVEQSAKMHRIGIVANTVPLEEWKAAKMADGSPHAGSAIREGLRALGWIEGKNVQYLWRSAEGRFERLPALFEELTRVPVDVLVAIGPGAVEAAKVTRTIPIVMSASAGAVDIGLAASLGRPGTNVTGLSLEVPRGLDGKRLEFLKRSAPHVSRVALLSEGDGSAGISTETRTAADALGVSVFSVSFEALGDLEKSYTSAVMQGADAILVTDGVWVHRRGHQLAINALAIRHRLPIIHTALGGADTGGLLAYGIDTMAQYRRIPYFIDRIFKGARPADLPIEQPVKFELVVNLKVAGILGLTLPPSLMIQADRVIE